MGRPLNKKYFGNRNIGVGGYEVTGNLSNSQNYADDRIGGEGIGSVFFDDMGLNIGAYLERIPAVTFKAPSIPGGVRALGFVSHVQAVKALINNKGSGYQIGDIIEVQGGTGDYARFRVTKLRVLDVTITDQANSQNFDGGENLVWDSLVDDNWTSPTILRAITSTGSPNYDLGAGPRPYDVGASTYGVWDGYVGGGTAAAPASLPITGGGNGYNTRGSGTTNGGIGDSNGSGGTANFTYGIEAVEVVVGNEGDYTAVPSVASATQRMSGVGNNAATLDVFYGVKTVAFTQKGSGYISADDGLPTFSATTDGNEVLAVGGSSLTTDSGNTPGTNNNQENAIIIHANTANNGNKIGDIIKQSNTRSYKVRTADGIAVCKLVASDTPANKQAYVLAFDINDNSYFATKITEHRVTLSRYQQNNGAPWQFVEGASAPWTFLSGITGTVYLDNA